MKIILNDQETEVSELKGPTGLTVNNLLKETAFSAPVIMVRVNDRLIKKTNYDDFIVKPGDDVAIIPLVGGG